MSMRTALTLILAIVSVLASLAASPAAAQGSGTIEGRIVNGTAGAPPPADLDVKIHIVQNRAKTGEQVVRTDAEGRFRATGLAGGPDTIYFPIVDYRGVPYFPAQPIVLDGATPASVEITVYEATPTPDNIMFERANMILMNVSPTALGIMEMGALVNSGDRTFAADPEVTGSARTLRFTLPTGAIQISPQAGLPSDTLESTAEGFATTDPVRPGRREIAFSYQLPYDSSSLELTRSFTLPVGTFTLYVPDQGIEVLGPGLMALGTSDLGGQRFRLYAVQNLEPGASARFRLSGLPAPLFARPRELGLAVAGLAGVVLLVVLVIAIRRRRAVPTAPGAAAEGPGGAAEAPAAAAEAPAPVLAVTDPERLQLVRSLAELDERFAAGGVDEAAYRAEREAGLARLLALHRASAGS